MSETALNSKSGIGQFIERGSVRWGEETRMFGAMAEIWWKKGCLEVQCPVQTQCQNRAFPQGESLLEAGISGEAKNGLHVREKGKAKVKEG